MLEPVQVPPSTAIESWDKISDPPIVETVPRSVPLSSFIKYPAEGHFQNHFSSKVKLDHAKSLQNSEILDSFTQATENLLVKVYTRRGFSRTIYHHIETLKTGNSKQTPTQFTDEKAAECTKKLIRPLINLLTEIKNNIVSISFLLQSIFGNKENIDFWKQGQYSDTFLDKFCLLIYRISALEQLVPSNKSIANDLSFYMKTVGHAKVQKEIQQIHPYYTDFQILSKTILTSLMTIPADLALIIFDVIFRHIQTNLINPSFLNPELQFAYIVTLIFIVRFYDQRKMTERELWK